ncbi:MAG: hypothetical protein OXF96_07005 [Chloroflexi bacterium]|nr:hypothetical protein [Chloroflexota bacterium]
MKTAAWLAGTVVALILAAVVGLERLPLATPAEPRQPHFPFGPVVGSVTQTIEMPRGSLDSMVVWTRSRGTNPAAAEAHLLRSPDGPPIRSAVFEAPAGADLQATRIPFAPIDLSPGTLWLRIGASDGSAAPIFVGATLGNVYPDGQLTDRLGDSPVDIDLAFLATGSAGALTRWRAQASEAPFHLAIGLTVALLAGAAAGRVAWSSLEGAPFGRIAAVTVGAGAAVATAMGPLLGPVAFL